MDKSHGIKNGTTGRDHKAVDEEDGIVCLD